MGAIFDYRDANNFLLFEMGATFSRLRQKFRGSFQTIGKTGLWTLLPGEWNHIKISIYSNNVVINAGRSEKGFPVFNVSRIKGRIHQFRVCFCVITINGIYCILWRRLNHLYSGSSCGRNKACLNSVRFRARKWSHWPLDLGVFRRCVHFYHIGRFHICLQTAVMRR